MTTTQLEPKPNDWARPLLLGSAAVLTLAVLAALVFPRARAAITAAVIVSPIPPIP